METYMRPRRKRTSACMRPRTCALQHRARATGRWFGACVHMLNWVLNGVFNRVSTGDAMGYSGVLQRCSPDDAVGGGVGELAGEGVGEIAGEGVGELAGEGVVGVTAQTHAQRRTARLGDVGAIEACQ